MGKSAKITRGGNKTRKKPEASVPEAALIHQFPLILPSVCPKPRQPIFDHNLAIFAISLVSFWAIFEGDGILHNSGF